MRLVTAGAALLLVCSAQAQGFFEAIPSYTSGLSGFAQSTIGWSFQPSTDISVTALGCFNYIVATHAPVSVGLWASNGSLLASNSISADSVLVNQTRYEPTSGILLAAHQTYYLGAYDPGQAIVGDAVDPAESLGSVSPASQIQLGSIVYSSDLAFEFPTVPGAEPGSAFLVPNFEFQAVPEPSSVWLASLGVVLVAARRFSHRK